MGKKYIIEVEDKPFELLSEDGFTSEKLFRVKGFNSLVFDWNGLNMLTPYTEDSAYAHGYTEAESKYREIRDELEKQAYQQGYEQGYKDGYNEPGKEKIQVGDEVIDPNGQGVVTEITDLYVRIMYAKGSGQVVKPEDLTKTGRHFPEIAEVLRKMKETDNG